MNELEKFIDSVKGFDSLSSSEKIPFFMLFLESENKEYIMPAEVRECFDKLCIKPYSNIAQFLSNKSKGKADMFIKAKNGYKLSRTYKKNIATMLSNEPPTAMPSNDLLDVSIFQHAPYYIQRNAQEMCHCYDKGLFDACLVMMRKLMETLIIECFMRHSADGRIKDCQGHYFYLSDLIPEYISAAEWGVSRNIQKSLPKVKLKGDLSAHNPRFLAKKTDIDEFKFELRQATEEIILNIDYINWIRG